MDKIVFCDIDGTIMPTKKIISIKTIETINKLERKNIGFVLCSGRCRNRVLSVAAQADTSKFVICSNGADVYDFKNDIQIYKDKINLYAITKIYDLCKTFNLNILFKCGKFDFINHPFDCKTEAEIVSRQDLKKMCEYGVAQINVMSNNKNNLLELMKIVQRMRNVEISNLSKALIQPDDFSISCDNTSLYIDINNKGTTKGVGIEKLSEYLNVPLENTLAIGDSINDLSMFEKSGVDVAVLNSINNLKNNADIITKSNDNEGVAKFLEKYFNL